MSENAGKLDQSLDDILKTRRQSTRRGRGPRRAGAGRPAAVEAPVGGVQKNLRAPKINKAVPTGPAARGNVESKIMVSNLPTDVDEHSLKEYFNSSKCTPKRIMLQYGPTGKSLGSATVIFHKADHAAKAVSALDGIKIDNRLIKVEVLVSARDAPAPATLADRISQVKKANPKPATAPRAADAGARGRGARARGAGARGGRVPRDKKKTVEELDAEMADYFPAPDATNGSAAEAVGGDIAMDDEML